MRGSRSRSGAVALALATLLGSGLGASLQRGARRQSVYVVAVKDSGVLTMCPALREAAMANGRTWKPDGRVVVARFTDDLQLLRFPPRTSPADSRADPRLRTEIRTTQAILPIARTAAEEAGLPATSGAIELGRDLVATDSALREAVERELTRLGTHTVVDSVDGADLVLLIEGSYVGFAAAITSDASKIPSDAGQAPPAIVTFAQPGDWQRNLLQSVLAIAVPAGVYRANAGDIPALQSARIWEGSEVAQPPYRVREIIRATDLIRWETRETWDSASPEALVWQFAAKKPRPASHPPLCAASNQTFQMTAGASTAADVSMVPEGRTSPAVPNAGASRSPAAFKTGVTYVSLPVSVTDGAGRAVVDLDPSLLRIYEDETPQAIDRVVRPGEPFTVAILIDTSSSMRRKADETHAATVAAVDAFSRIGVPVIVSFDRRVMLHSTLPDTRDRRRPGINEPSPTVGRTATRFYDALALILTGPLKAPSARTALVILSDGVDTASRLADADTARRRLGESHIPVYVIHYDTSKDNAPASLGAGFGLSVNGAVPDMKSNLVPEGAGDVRPVHMHAAEFVGHIADISGGRLIAAPAVDDLAKTFGEIAKELSQQYTLAYYPKNQARDGTYRRIRVEVDGPDLRVRARAGYYQAPAADVPRRK